MTKNETQREAESTERTGKRRDRAPHSFRMTSSEKSAGAVSPTAGQDEATLTFFDEAAGGLIPAPPGRAFRRRTSVVACYGMREMATPSTTAPRTLTHRDLDDTPDDGNLWEVIDGEIHASPFPTPKHQQANTFVREHGIGRVFTSGLKVVLDEPTGVGPDLVYISAAKLGGLRDDGYYGAPDLIVEVLSSKPGLDRFVKRDKYARAGVPHYWIIDPVIRTLEAHRLEGDRYALPLEFAGDAIYEPDFLPGLRVPLRDLWM